MKYGIGELYGKDISRMSPDDIRQWASQDQKSAKCPFKARTLEGDLRPCNKSGGVCSLRHYSRNQAGEIAIDGPPIATCPCRFLEGQVVSQWVGEIVLNCLTPIAVTEVPFLISTKAGEGRARAVGKIDQVLVNPDQSVFSWCALEVQAVSFSGASMIPDLLQARNWNGPGLPPPVGNRHPDFRSSGPKRLMPQLQTKVPTISRWGKKTAVIVDGSFWKSLAEMEEENDLSNSEIVWFVCNFKQGESDAFHLVRGDTHFTTLRSAVNGLTGGTPVSLAVFEDLIRKKLRRL